MDALLFLIEQGACETERGFLHALYKDRRDKLSLAAYSDWLEENGRTMAAESVRNGQVPGIGYCGDQYGGFFASGQIVMKHGY